MKLRIEKVFRDKGTGELYKVGEVHEFSDERAEEILRHPMELVSRFEEPAQEEKPKKAARKAAPKKK